MTKKYMRNLKRNVRRNLYGKNLILSCMIMLLKYAVQSVFFIFLILLISSFTKITFIENFIPQIFLQIKNSYKLLFITFLCPMVLMMYFITLFLKLGIKRWYYLLTKDSTTNFLEIFYYCKGKKLMLSALKLKLFTMLRLWISGCQLLLLPTLLFVLSSIKMQTCEQRFKICFACAVLISVIIFFIGTLYFIRQLIICNLYKVIFFSQGVKNFSKEIKKIKLIFKRNKLDNFKFLTSLFYYFFSCIFILPILIAVPYFYMTLYMYTETIMKRNQEILVEPKHKLFYIDINN